MPQPQGGLGQPKGGLGQPIGSASLGLGDLLATQAADETDEERRKRLAQMQSQAGAGGLSSMMGVTRANALSSAYSGAY